MAANDDDLAELTRVAAGSKRGIDLLLVKLIARMDATLDEVMRKTNDAHLEVFGGPGGRIGLAEKVRTQLRYWSVGFAVVSLLLGSWTWIYERIFKVPLVTPTPVFGAKVQEKWMKESTKRIKIYNKDTSAWEYYYMIEEQKPAEVQTRQ